MRPDHDSALKAIGRSMKDIDTAKTLIAIGKFDWSLAVSYNAMLSAGRAFMFDKGFRPSSTDGHVAVVRFLQATLDVEAERSAANSLDRRKSGNKGVIFHWEHM